MALVISPPPLPPPPSSSLRPLLYYALVVVATAALVLTLYNVIILRWCSEHRRRRRRRHHSRQSEAQRSTNTANFGQICSFKFKKEMGIKIHDEEQGYEPPECSICLSVFEEEDELKRLPRCMHCFHSYCIDKWLLNSHFNCPLCRADVVVESSDERQHKEANQLPVMNSHVVIILPAV